MRLRKLARIGPEGWWLLVRAQLAILRAHRVVRSSRTGTLTRAGGRRNPASGTDPAGGGRMGSPASALPLRSRQQASALAWAVGVMGRRGVTPAECLVQSLALVDLLGRDGLGEGRVRVGVRERNGKVDAHAWVEWDGSVLGDDPAVVAEYRRFSELEVGVPTEFGDRVSVPARPGPPVRESRS